MKSMSFLSILAVAMCAKPELSPSDVEETPCLAGLGGRAKERQPVLVEACWRGRSRMVGLGGGVACWVWEEKMHTLQLIILAIETNLLALSLPPIQWVLKRECASESSGGFVGTQLTRPHPQSFCLSRSGAGSQDSQLASQWDDTEAISQTLDHTE